jgi:Arc/MetJ family transcription regulator
MFGRTREYIEIDDDLVRTVMERYRLRTRTEAVEMALRALVGQPMSRDEAVQMHGANAIDEIPPESPVR